MAGTPWSDDEVAFLQDAAGRGLTDREIAAQLPLRNHHSVSQKRMGLGLMAGLSARGERGQRVATLSRVVSETPERTVFASDETSEESLEDLWLRAEKRVAREVAKSKYDGVAKVQIMTDKPIAISISSDWHVSTSNACDLPGLRKYAEAVRDTPGVFALGVGDMADNPIKWSKQMRDVPDEWKLVGFLLGTFGLKMLGTTSGNHDDWTVAFSGVDALKDLAKRNRIHYAPDEITWIVELVDPKSQEVTARYVIATRHKFRRNSTMNWTHACWRYLEERTGQWPLGEDGGELVPDIIAIGDNHVAEVAERDYANKPIWAVRMGPWQTGSSFGRQFGYSTCPPTAPTFILYPHREKRIWGSASYADVLDVLANERMRKAA